MTGVTEPVLYSSERYDSPPQFVMQQSDWVRFDDKPWPSSPPPALQLKGTMSPCLHVVRCCLKTFDRGSLINPWSIKTRSVGLKCSHLNQDMICDTNDMSDTGVVNICLFDMNRNVKTNVLASHGNKYQNINIRFVINGRAACLKLERQG